jgi:hypothetical protein
MADRPRLITGSDFAEALAAAGVIDDIGTIGRIVIDVKPDDVVRLHVERYGDERLLQVLRTLDGIEVREVSRKADTS